jgi:protoporphyrinogen oxidase
MEYDYTIIGAGPAGLTCAYYLGKKGKKVLLIDKNETVGGCHRVTRLNGLFSEHSPRFYSDSYVNFQNLLLNFGTSFNTLFRQMKFSSSTVLKSSIFKFKSNEISAFIIEFLRLFYDQNYSKNMTMDNLFNQYNFSSNSMDFLNRVCRLTDGADSSRYTLYQFLQITNQQLIHKLYQPKEPNDTGLFKIWLDNLDNCTVKLKTDIKEINYQNKSIIVDNQEVFTKNFILALPPKPLEQILTKSKLLDAFISNDFDKWVDKNKYDEHISICFHWDHKIELQDKWTIPETDWEVAYIVLSDYMYFNDLRSVTVISTTITNTNSISKVTNKTANQSNKEELINEVFRQLTETFINLPKPTNIVFNPLTFYEDNKWSTGDDAYVRTIGNTLLDSHSSKYNNLFNVGTQNDNSSFNFTSIESAVENAVHLVNKLEPDDPIKVFKCDNIIDIVKFLLVISFILYIFRKI